MQPIGTITRYYSFLDSRSREIIDPIVQEAENLYDFYVRLGERTCSDEVPLSLAFIAAIWAWKAEVTEIREKIAQKYGKATIIAPWTFSRLSPTEGLALQRKMTEALNDALASMPDGWIRMELLFRKVTITTATTEGSEAFEDAKSLWENTPRLESYGLEIIHGEARIKDVEGEKRGAIELYWRALDNARKQDDQYLTVMILLDLASDTVLTDFHMSMGLIDEAHRISKRLGIPKLVRSTLCRMCVISHALGEYDLALKSLMEAYEIKSAFRTEEYHFPLDISDIYSDLGNGQEALSWALSFEELEEGGPGGLSFHGCPDFAMARALLLLDRMDEAIDHIDRLKDIAFKTGWEPWLAGYYLVSGLNEIANDEIANGMQIIQSSLEIGDRLNMQTFVNRCLIALVRAEIMNYEVNDNTSDPRDSGPWMVRLEKEAREKRLPGILMQHALLKGQFRIKLKQIGAAREILESALEISDEPSVMTLRDQILDQVKDIEKFSLS